MSDLIAPDVHAPIVQQLPWLWGNRSVTRYTGKINELRMLLPNFKRRADRYGEHEIISDKWGETVVGRVSPSYVLVQHCELLDSLPHVLRDEGYELSDLRGEMSLSNHGERMELVIDLQNQHATPADGYPLTCRLRLLNSVDRSTALEAELQWYRQICSNGMFGWAGDRHRQLHRFGNPLVKLQDNLRRRFERLPADRIHFALLMQMPAHWNDLRDWADVFVARRWGKEDAARVLHICRTGKDGVAQYPMEEQPAHEVEVTATNDVPGACAPVNNVYHVGQALSWVAAGADALHTRFSRTAEVPELLRPLMN